MTKHVTKYSAGRGVQDKYFIRVLIRANCNEDLMTLQHFIHIKVWLFKPCNSTNRKNKKKIIVVELLLSDQCMIKCTLSSYIDKNYLHKLTLKNQVVHRIDRFLCMTTILSLYFSLLEKLKSAKLNFLMDFSLNLAERSMNSANEFCEFRESEKITEPWIGFNLCILSVTCAFTVLR